MKIKTIPSASNAHHYQLLIKDLLENSLRVNPNHEIVYKDQERLNYYQLYDRIKQLCNMYGVLGLDGGSVVGVIDYDSHRFLMNYFAVPITGNVLHTVNWRLAPEQILYTINHAEDEVLIVHEDFLPVVETFFDRLETVKKIIVIKEKGSKINTTIVIDGFFDELLLEQSTIYEFPEFSEEAIATLFYTTGTTGNPKAVYFSHRQLVLHTMVESSVLSMMNEAFKIKSSDVYLPLTPMFHVHAWGLPYLATTLSLKQVYVGKFEPQSFIDIFRREKPTISHCVPTILNMLLSSPAARDIDLSTWSVLIGGSALSKPLAKRALDRGISVVTGYGMSETCPLLTSSYLSLVTIKNDIESQLDIRTMTGRAALLVDLKIVDEEGREVPKDGKSLGEIIVRAPYLTMGYYKEKEKGEELWQGGYLHTGDIAWINENNDIKIVDRSKDVIKTGGEWMSSLALEEMIGSYQGINDVAVIGVPDVKWGERPFALVVCKEGFTLSEQELKDHMQKFVDQKKINKWAIPDRFVFVEVIPKTSVGKISKKKIREMYASHEI
ncbi:MULTISPECIES: fatty acid--CoA ligase [Myroides]|uniref:fatty acid--CoA ligase n=1 Tax=Myroides TaxID=76831 RepID=UPI00132797C1|nr:MULTISPECIES: fatty acid--CoA ligase [Myroides]MVX34790.1 long-chain-fatty-acid--CoA ligase [Myroides sp. LoEW2-1]UVD80166.1 fatty acid--CoA ligase [Myroides albus]